MDKLYEHECALYSIFYRIFTAEKYLVYAKESDNCNGIDNDETAISLHYLLPRILNYFLIWKLEN